MPKIRFTKEDLLKRNQLSAGWRELKVKSIEEGPGKRDPTATVYATVFIVEGGPDDGTPVNHWFSEKAPERIADFVKCFVVSGKVEQDKDYELDDTVGRNIQGYCQYDMQQGFNVIKDFKPTAKK